MADIPIKVVSIRGLVAREVARGETSSTRIAQKIKRAAGKPVGRALVNYHLRQLGAPRIRGREAQP